MRTIIISGPSGSGKTILSHKLLELFQDSIVLNTDSYYRDNILIRFLSIFRFDIYDRIISIKRKEISKIISSLNNKEELISISHYDFKKRKSSYSKMFFNYNGENQFLILEGIFSHRLCINYNNTINIVCEEEKEICLKRRIIRDQIERNRNIIEVNKKFNVSWNLFYKNIKKYLKFNKVILLNPVDKISYNKLIVKLKKLKKDNQKKN